MKYYFIFINQKYRKGEYITTLKREPEKENPKPGSKFYDSVMVSIEHHEHLLCIILIVLLLPPPPCFPKFQQSIGGYKNHFPLSICLSKSYIIYFKVKI